MELVKQILAFNRLSEEGMQSLKAGMLLKEAVKLLLASLPSIEWGMTSETRFTP